MPSDSRWRARQDALDVAAGVRELGLELALALLGPLEPPLEELELLLGLRDPVVRLGDGAAEPFGLGLQLGAAGLGGPELARALGLEPFELVVEPLDEPVALHGALHVGRVAVDPQRVLAGGLDDLPAAPGGGGRAERADPLRGLRGGVAVEPDLLAEQEVAPADGAPVEFGRGQGHGPGMLAHERDRGARYAGVPWVGVVTDVADAAHPRHLMTGARPAPAAQAARRPLPW